MPAPRRIADEAEEARYRAERRRRRYDRPAPEPVIVEDVMPDRTQPPADERPDGEPRPGRARQRTARAASGPPRARRRSSDLLARVLIAVPAAVLAIGFADLGGTGWAAIMAILGCLAVYELYRMLERWQPVPWVGYLAVLGMCAAARFGGARDTYAVAVAAIPVAFVAVAARNRIRGSTVAIAGTLLGVFWLGFAFSHAVLLRQLPHGLGIVIDVMVGTFLGDTGAYFGGRWFGHRPLAPEISPNKTVEGLICGMLAAIVGVFLADLYQTAWLTRGEALALGAAIAVLGPIGDLFESMVKRDAGTKDAGTVFGAHGGVLDRLDAISFTVVAGYFIWAAIR
jgi:phosphatidate cytidylyltransferase